MTIETIHMCNHGRVAGVCPSCLRAERDQLKAENERLLQARGLECTELEEKLAETAKVAIDAITDRSRAIIERDQLKAENERLTSLVAEARVESDAWAMEGRQLREAMMRTAKVEAERDALRAEVAVAKADYERMRTWAIEAKASWYAQIELRVHGDQQLTAVRAALREACEIGHTGEYARNYDERLAELAKLSGLAATDGGSDAGHDREEP